ncbi:hypothetical protein E3N88_11550 [Mikania micrantha]|uniref:V-type proton ATPase subunit E n=1 Tax=Mikania micrantha TaxID=192012 RepID=A0A5N6PET0_9ASTR|nr:hypothetical protein E3N88_11550 [Mikania micrantha]
MGRGEYRTNDMLSSKWRDMNLKVRKFNGIYSQKWQTRRSGQSDAMIELEAEDQYREEFNAPFSLQRNVSKQIQQMVAFIRQEAEEKANEISVSAEEEFNIQKMQIVEIDKKKVRQEFDRKTKQVDVKKKIEYSMQLNASRIKVLQAQDDLVTGMKESASNELLNVSHNKKTYKKLIQNLIVQSLLRLREPSVLLRCREVDLSIVESALEESKKEYASKAKVQPPRIDIDKTVFLPPPPTNADPHRPSWYLHPAILNQNKRNGLVWMNKYRLLGRIW